MQPIIQPTENISAVAVNFLSTSVGRLIDYSKFQTFQSLFP